jgi:hypothetical protein
MIRTALRSASCSLPCMRTTATSRLGPYALPPRGGDGIAVAVTPIEAIGKAPFQLLPLHRLIVIPERKKQLAKLRRR